MNNGHMGFRWNLLASVGLGALEAVGTPVGFFPVPGRDYGKNLSPAGDRVYKPLPKGEGGR